MKTFRVRHQLAIFGMLELRKTGVKLAKRLKEVWILALWGAMWSSKACLLVHGVIRFASLFQVDRDLWLQHRDKPLLLDDIPSANCWASLARRFLARLGCRSSNESHCCSILTSDLAQRKGRADFDFMLQCGCSCPCCPSYAPGLGS